LKRSPRKKRADEYLSKTVEANRKLKQQEEEFSKLTELVSVKTKSLLETSQREEELQKKVSVTEGLVSSLTSRASTLQSEKVLIEKKNENLEKLIQQLKLDKQKVNVGVAPPSKTNNRPFVTSQTATPAFFASLRPPPVPVVPVTVPVVPATIPVVPVTNQRRRPSLDILPKYPAKKIKTMTPRVSKGPHTPLLSCCSLEPFGLVVSCKKCNRRFHAGCLSDDSFSQGDSFCCSHCK